MERGGKKSATIPEEEKEDEPSLLPMTPESKQLAAVIATAVATAMAGRSAPPDSSSSVVRYSAGVSLASRTRSIIGRRDYYPRHSFARRHANADPSTEGLADQQREWKIREDDWRREAQERARQHEFWATKARNLSAWAPKGMG